jgi:hypothetical protein
MNRALRLEDASLRDPERIDVLARRMGLVPPEPGQVIRMDSGARRIRKRAGDGECRAGDADSGTVVALLSLA